MAPRARRFSCEGFVQVPSAGVLTQTRVEDPEHAGVLARTSRFVTELLQRFPDFEHAYRSCQGASLAKRYGPQRVKAACASAVELVPGSTAPCATSSSTAASSSTSVHPPRATAPGREKSERPRYQGFSS